MTLFESRGRFGVAKEIQKMKRLMAIAVAIALPAFAAEGYHVLNKIKIGGTGGWDYVSVDSNAHRLYATHATTVEVVDLDTGKAVALLEQRCKCTGYRVQQCWLQRFIPRQLTRQRWWFD